MTGVATKTLGHWLDAVGSASSAFEARWTLPALRRVDDDLAQRLRLQIADFDKACVVGSMDEVAVQGAATCRGWAAAVRVMEASQAPDDAYLIGFDPETGFRIAIGSQVAAAGRVAAIHGRDVPWYSADEIAALMSRVEGLKTLSAIKTLWPGSTVVDLDPDEPAKGDLGFADLDPGYLPDPDQQQEQRA